MMVKVQVRMMEDLCLRSYDFSCLPIGEMFLDYHSSGKQNLMQHVSLSNVPASSKNCVTLKLLRISFYNKAKNG